MQIKEYQYILLGLFLSKKNRHINHWKISLPLEFNLSKIKYNLHINTSIFQLKCCGVENYEDFSRATEFQKYIREPGHPNQNQIIPEACCKLKEDKDLKYFEPKDPNCIEVPTVTNSYYTNVSFIVQIEI